MVGDDFKGKFSLRILSIEVLDDMSQVKSLGDVLMGFVRQLFAHFFLAPLSVTILLPFLACSKENLIENLHIFGLFWRIVTKILRTICTFVDFPVDKRGQKSFIYVSGLEV